MDSDRIGASNLMQIITDSTRLNSTESIKIQQFDGLRVVLKG